MEQLNAIGRRKTSVARIYLTSGKGEIKVNRRSLENYFPSEVLRMIVQQPLHQAEVAEHYSIQVNVRGGGLKGQAEAIRLAIARVLCQVNVEYRPGLKQAGYLTRDPRMVERKKYGRRKARKKFQFSKR
ncbi:MAG: 30S ribosomal protein S9 [Amoebophilaceae bacterium]|jgi:small subunit ribosomal protein S9|nr:30S ribosomal protein S9 [Amoebophilaceae bacterium]